jgi:hypothetical protein
MMSVVLAEVLLSETNDAGMCMLGNSLYAHLCHLTNGHSTVVGLSPETFLLLQSELTSTLVHLLPAYLLCFVPLVIFCSCRPA